MRSIPVQEGLWVDSAQSAREFTGLAPAGVLSRIFGLEPERCLRRMPGRETFPWPGRSEWVVKRTRGGEARDHWHDRLRGRSRSPARREAENLAALRAIGVASPRPLLWVEEEAARGHPSRGGRSALVLETVPHAESLRQRLERAQAPERRSLSRELLDLVVRLHQGGWVHRDLYLEHMVLSAEGGRERLVLLDAGRARRPRLFVRRWLVKDLAALLHSTPGTVSRAERLRFLLGWLEDVQGSRAAVRRWARAIERKRRALARHAPRHVDPDSVEGLARASRLEARG